MMMTNQWTSPQKTNIFCLPFSGASFYSYNGFDKHTPDHVNIVGIDLPGHGRRISEPLLTDVHAMVEDVWRTVKDNLDARYAIYGHSLGAILAYLLTKKIVEAHQPPPLRLFVSGRGGPSIKGREDPLHLLPDEEFAKKLAEYGGTPKEVLQEKELMNFVIPIMRADFQAVDTYQHENAELLSIPITVMIGCDEDVTYEDALKWEDVTTGEVFVRQFPGGHFFIFDHLTDIGRLICKDMETATSVSEKH